jgi:hypothetical protein
MKLNFWQWLGVVLLIVGVAMYLYERRGGAPQPNVSTTTSAS